MVAVGWGASTGLRSPLPDRGSGKGLHFIRMNARRLSSFPLPVTEVIFSPRGVTGGVLSSFPLVFGVRAVCSYQVVSLALSIPFFLPQL
jgi:hypothetical protein